MVATMEGINWAIISLGQQLTTLVVRARTAQRDFEAS